MRITPAEAALEIAQFADLFAAVPSPRRRPPRGPRRGRLDPTGKLRVGLACPCLVQGGAEAWQLALARFTDGDQIDWRGCCVVSPDAPTDPAMVAATAALMPVTVGREALKALAAEVDVLVAWAVPDIAQVVKGYASPPRLVAVMHAPVEAAQWSRQAYGGSAGIDLWVAVSELALESLAAMEITTPSRVIWNCVDPDRLALTRTRAETRAAWGVPDGALVAGYIGRLSAEKDPLAMVRLAANLPEPWRVVVVGAGCERLDLVAPPNLILTGADHRAGDCLNAFDTLAVPSHYESFGLSLAEGLWKGLPVVSTMVGVAKMVPGIATEIPVNADGPTLAAAVLKAHADRSPRPGPDLADCGDGVWVGSHVACNADALAFDRVIHIWRADRAWGVCDHVLGGVADYESLILHWTEEGAIDSMVPALADVAAFAAGPGTLLVHCAAGITRSTAVALSCKIARGCEPERAEAEVRAAMLRDRGRPVVWAEPFLPEIKAGAGVGSLTPAWRPSPLTPALAILPRLAPERFGDEWTDLLCELVPAQVATATANGGG